MASTPSSAADDSKKQRRKSSRSSRPKEASPKQRNEGDEKGKSKEESSSRRRMKEAGESSREKRDLRRHKSPDMKGTSTEKKSKSERRGSAEKRRPSVDESSISQLRRSSHSSNPMRSPNSVGKKRLGDEGDKKGKRDESLRRSSMRSPNSVGKKKLSDGEADKDDKKADSLKQLRRSSHSSNPMKSPNSVGNKKLDDDGDKKDKRDSLKKLRRSSHHSERSKSSGRGGEGDKGKKDSRFRLGGGRRKSKKKSAAEDNSDRSDNDEDPDDNEEKQPKRSSLADGAKKKLSKTKPSLERRASSSSRSTGKAAPKRFSKAFRRTSSEGARYIGRNSASKEGADQPTKRLSLDSSLKLLGESFSDLDPEQKKSRRRSISSSSHKPKDVSAKGESQGGALKQSVRRTQAERKSLRRSSNSLEDLYNASDTSSGSGSDDENDDTSSPPDLRQSTRRSSDSSSSIPKDFRKSRLDLIDQKTDDFQKARSTSVESARNTKAKRRHTEKIPLRRSNSVDLKSDKRKGRRHSSIDKRMSKLSRRRSSTDKKLAEKALDDSHSEKEEECNTRAGESTSELEALMQKNASTKNTGSIKSTKSSVSSDKHKTKKRKKRKKRRKWFSFCGCAIMLSALIVVGIVFMIGRAYYRAEAEEEAAKTNSSSMVIGMGTPAVSTKAGPSQAPTATEVLAQSSFATGVAEDVAVVVIVQLDERPDETGFSLISADNTTTYIYYPFGSLSGQQSEVITEVLNIPANTEVVFTLSDTSGGICCENGNGYYRVFSGSGEQKRSLISGERNSEWRFKVGSDTAVQTGGIDPNESCKPCPDGKQCGRCAWCNADRGFLPDTIFSYQCHTPPISVTEKCFIGAKRIQLHNQYVAAMAKCTNGFEPWPQLQSTSESTVCVSEAKCIQKYSFVDPDCESELSGSVLVRESCQDIIGGLAFGYDFGFNAPRENECLPGPYSMADFAEAIATRCCADGVAFCSTFGENSITSDVFTAPLAAVAGPEPTLSPTTSLRPTVSDGYQMTIVIMLDNFPKETGWSITSKDSTATYMKRVPGYYREANKLIVETVPLPEGSNAIFTITDKEGDGVCCENGEGYFQIYTADGSLVVDEGGAFASSKSVNVFAGKPLTLSPTVSMVPSASSAPSQGLYPMTIDLQFDQWATETGIFILSLDGNVLYEWSPGSFGANQRFVETLQLPYESEVIFRATDSGGDGFCCTYGDGSITIYAGNDAADETAVIESKTGEFQSELSFSFLVGPPPTSSPAVTSIPTASKTNSISGSPTITSQPSVRSLEVTVVVQFDKYSAETGYFIDSADGTTNYVARPLGYFQNEQSGKAVETFALPEGLSYRFKIIDLFGDGTCCWAGAGYYAVYEGKNIDDINSQLFFGDGEFGLAREHFFTVGTVQTLAPSVSSRPSVSPSFSPTTKPSISSSPTETMYIVDMTVKLDSKAMETGFFIASISDGTVYFDRPPGYYNGMDKETIEESIPLPAGQYHFALLDTGGDGFCCQNGFGFYSLYANANGDVLVFSDGQFGDAKNETFSVGEFSGEAVTKSGTNGLRGSLLHRQRNHSD
mmetsp:Transcript_6527/g.13774  ORF Transcript_6527/g.13774 Transcript_6527/m.13774 type:complete len:1564 (+) Transcript_6527:120-4811(+)